MQSLVIEQIILRTEKAILSSYTVLPFKHSSPKEKTEGIKEAGLKERRKGSFVGYKRSVGPLWDQIMYLQSVEIGGTNKTGKDTMESTNSLNTAIHKDFLDDLGPNNNSKKH